MTISLSSLISSYGSTGPAGNIAVGTITSVSPVTAPSITNSGNLQYATFNFSLPIAPNVRVGSSTTGSPGSAVSVTNSGTSGNVVLDFTIPRGNVGPSANLVMAIAVSDETTNITTGNAKITFRAPYAMTLYQIPRASLNTASSSGNPAIDINKNGSSIFSTVLTIDANEKTSVTAATPAVLSSNTFADDDEITIDIDTAGTGAKGLKVVIYYTTP